MSSNFHVKLIYLRAIQVSLYGFKTAGSENHIFGFSYIYDTRIGSFAWAKLQSGSAGKAIPFYFFGEIGHHTTNQTSSSQTDTRATKNINMGNPKNKDLRKKLKKSRQ